MKTSATTTYAIDATSHRFIRMDQKKKHAIKATVALTLIQNGTLDMIVLLLPWGIPKLLYHEPDMVSNSDTGPGTFYSEPLKYRVFEGFTGLNLLNLKTMDSLDEFHIQKKCIRL